jgi:hypothetical protein
MEWTDLAKDRDQCRAFTKILLNLRVPYNAGNWRNWKRLEKGSGLWA